MEEIIPIQNVQLIKSLENIARYFAIQGSY